MGLPIEPFTMLGSALLGGVMKLWSMKLDEARARNEIILSKFSKQAEATKEARKVSTPRREFTRQVIVVGSVCAIIVVPLLAPLWNPDLHVTFGWTEWRPGFLFIEGKEVLKFHEVKGFAITPMHTQLMSAIVGFFLGDRIDHIKR